MASPERAGGIMHRSDVDDGVDVNFPRFTAASDMLCDR